MNCSRLAKHLVPPLLLGLATLSVAAQTGAPGLRPPAVPLVAHDPYFSIWSPADRLTDAGTMHWTGKPHPLRSLLRVDGQLFRLMGAEPAAAPALPQRDLQVLPTRTIYSFANSQVTVTLTFLTPALPSNLDLLARPLTYLSWEVQSADGQPHAVQLYFDAGPELAVNTADQSVGWSRPAVAGLSVLRLGSAGQAALAKRGDDLRIDWGYLYIAAEQSAQPQGAIVSGPAARNQFALSGTLPAGDDTQQPRAVTNNAPVLAMCFDLGNVGSALVSRRLMIAYDDLYSIQYFSASLQPYWRRNGATPGELLTSAAQDYAAIAGQCASFDARLLADLSRVGGARYAQLCALSYRQTLAGNKIAADANGKPLMFPKENFSNGCIGTVDVLFPQAPFFLTFSPALTRAMLAPILDYAESRRWKFLFAPHDLGTYPWATGQVYGGGEQTEVNQMPDEETANMLIMLAALARAEGNAGFAATYWPLLRQWADFLVLYGLDPGNQLCSADMFGPLSHSANLALKSIIGIGAYGELCSLAGRADEGRHYLAIATNYAAQWQTLAADGNHTRLAYDLPGTWCMKHNLIWDRILGLGLFPDSVGDAEIAWYLSVQNTYGLPVDSRTTMSLIDWAAWSIALARNTNDFQALLTPLFNYANVTPNRVPLSDWFRTTDAVQSGFQARPVVGGLFIMLAADYPTWTNWAAQGATVSGPWALPPIWGACAETVPAAQSQPIQWRYTTTQPAAGWHLPGFDDSPWPQGPAGFGTAGTPGTTVRTTWSTTDIWLRRAFTLGSAPLNKPRLLAHHDETATVYLNGVLAATLLSYTTSYDQFGLAPEAVAALHPGTNMLAIHCQQTAGGQYIDAGIVEEPPVLPAAAPALTNLVAHWPLNVDTRDTVGAHDGQLVGVTNRAVGPNLGQGACYLGGASYIKAGTNYGLLFDTGTPFSAAAWIRGNPTNNDSTIIGKMTHGGAYTGWELHVGSSAGGSGPGRLNVWLINYFGSRYIQVNSPRSVLDGTWHHVAFSYDGSGRAAGVRIYVDGADATGPATADSLSGTLLNPAELNLGSRQNGTAHNFTGALREVSVWNTVLTPQNVASLFQAGVPPPPVRLSGPVFAPPSTFAFSWNSLVGAAYQVEASSNLSDWSPIESHYPAGGATGTNTVFTAGTGAQAVTFFRVRPES